MVSLLDQYETEIHETNDSSDDLNPFRTGFIQASLNSSDNEEIFKSQRVQINLQGKNIDQFEKSADQMALLFKPRTIRLLHIKNSTDETIESPDPVNRFFLDKTGKHLLVATDTNELYYYSRQSKKFKSINKLKGNLVTAVGWNKNSTDKTTDSILVGTKKGTLFELAINTTNEGLLSPYIDSYCKQVYNFGKESVIHGIEIIHLKKENHYSAPNIENIYDIIVATSNRLYEFIGNDSNQLQQSGASLNIGSNTILTGQPIFSSIFAYYESKSIHELANFFEMPGDIGYSQLLIRNNNTKKNRKKTLAWMTGGGIFLFEFDSFALAKFSAANFQNESVKRIINDTNHEIISYPQMKDDHLNDTSDLPIGISLTEFHLAIFYKAQVKILCLLNKELVLNQKLDIKSIGGRIMGIWYDSQFGDFGSYIS